MAKRHPTVQRLLKHFRVSVSVLFPVLVFGLLAYALVSHHADLHRAAAHASTGTLAAVTALALLALLARSEMAVVCLAAMGQRPTRQHIHAASSVGFTVSTLNHYIVSPVRAALLKRLDSEHAPTIPQMIMVDASTYMLEGVLAAIILLGTASTLRLRWWMPVIAIIGALTAVTVAIRLRTTFERQPMFHGFAMLGAPRSRAMVAGIVLAIFTFHILRTFVVLHSVGLHATLLQAAATFVAGGVLSALLAGPAAGTAAAPLLVFGGHHVGASALSGVILAGTALIAATTYMLVAAPVLLRRPRIATQRSVA